MAQETSLNSAEGQVLSERTKSMQTDITRTLDTVQDLQRKLEALAALAAAIEHLRQDLLRSTLAAGDHEKRLQAIERDMPGLSELRKWVIGGMLASVGMMGAALVKLVVVDPVRATAAAQLAPPPRPMHYVQEAP